MLASFRNIVALGIWWPASFGVLAEPIMTVRRMPWLPLAPDDFRRRCDVIDRMSAKRVGALRELANYELNDSQLLRLVRSLNKARAEEGDSPLQPFTLG